MLLDAFEVLLEKWYNEMVELHRRKGHDYATDEDMLANFKRMHEACKLYDIRPAERPEDVFWFYILIKLDRIRNLLRQGKSPDCESMNDTYDDIVLYIKLNRAFNLEQAGGLEEVLKDAIENRPPSRGAN